MIMITPGCCPPGRGAQTPNPFPYRSHLQMPCRAHHHPAPGRGRNGCAFTLLEMIIAVAVTAVLALLSIPVFTRVTASAKTGTDTATLAALSREAVAIAELRTSNTVAVPSQQDWNVALADCPNCTAAVASSPGVEAASGWSVTVYYNAASLPPSTAYGQVVVNDLATAFQAEMLSRSGQIVTVSSNGEEVLAAGTYHPPPPQSSASPTTAAPPSSGTASTGPPSVTLTAYPQAQTSEVNAAAALQVKASDSASLALTYSASGLPAGLTISPTTGLISGTPTAGGSSQVTVTVTDTAGASAHTAFSWTVDAPLSVQVAAGGGKMVLLSTGSSDAVVSGNATVSVAGPLEMASAAAGSLTLTGNAEVTSGVAISTTAADPATVLSSTGNSSVSPAPTHVSTVSDPLEDLPIPTASGLGLGTYSSSSLEGPGEYTSAVELSGKTSATLASGVYIFDRGLSLSGGAAISSGPGGVLLYVAGGSLTLSGNGAVNLAPMASGPWAGVVIFQSRTDSSTLALTGNGAGSVYGGTVYDPAGEVSLTGNGKLALGGLVAGQVAMTGNGAVNVDATVAFSQGQPSSYSVDAGGYPIPAISETGSLPPGLVFADNGDGTATVSGTPTTAGAWTVTVTATNSGGSVSQVYSLVVS